MSLPENDPLGLVGACPTCQAAYPYSHVRLLKKTQEQTLFHLTCEQCQHAMYFSVKWCKDGVMCSGVMTDCTFEDAQRFHSKEGVSIGDVIAVHEALESDWGHFVANG